MRDDWEQSSFVVIDQGKGELEKRAIPCEEDGYQQPMG